MSLSARLVFHPGRARRIRRFVGHFFLVTAGINAGMVAADPQAYRPFADPAALDFVQDSWEQIVMAHPAVWGLLLAGGELVLGILLLLGGRAARVGWVGVITFHLLLMFFGPGIWLWCIPVLAVLVPAAVADWPQLEDRAQGSSDVPLATSAGPSRAGDRR
jgi:hypothetical protein